MSKPLDNEGFSDHELIALTLNGNMEAWEILMKAHFAKAFQIAYGILGQKDDAEEATQDAFIRIFRALPKFRGDSEFSTWMYRIVVNRCHTLRKKQRRTKGITDEQETEQLYIRLKGWFK